MAFITISAEDIHGNPVANANNQVELHVSGAGRLIGLDNGDSTDYDEYQCTKRRMFSGKLLAIVAATLDTGALYIEAVSQGLLPACLELHSIASASAPTTSALFCCSSINNPAEFVPIRKIELISPMGQQLCAALPTIHVNARSYPESAPPQQLEWRITSISGTDSKIASLQQIESNNKKNDSVQITACGDGHFILRCSCRNGRDFPNVIASLEYQITGIGQLLHNPYEFLSASLYSSCCGTLTPGNERGIATARDTRTIITFDNLDFGNYGADTITIPIFELDGRPTRIVFCEGQDFSDQRTLLGDFCYHKVSQWNVYQPETFRFTRRLKGTTCFSMMVEHKIHIKGFTFERLNKAYQQLAVKDADQIYGDAFRIEQTAVAGIGNNVSLVFHDMDFGIHPAARLTIYGRCPIDKNTIHIRFKNQQEEFQQLAEFHYAEEYQEQTFQIAPVSGIQEVTFLFLPGSNFDFGWFQFGQC